MRATAVDRPVMSMVRQYRLPRAADDY